MKSRKELKAAYLQQKPQAGVFQIKNSINGKYLIEAAVNVNSKWNRHRTELRFGSHRNKKLQMDWNEMAEESFVFSILSELEIQESPNFDLQVELQLLLELTLEELDVVEGKMY